MVLPAAPLPSTITTASNSIERVVRKSPLDHLLAAGGTEGTADLGDDPEGGARGFDRFAQGGGPGKVGAGPR